MPFSPNLILSQKFTSAFPPCRPSSWTLLAVVGFRLFQEKVESNQINNQFIKGKSTWFGVPLSVT